MGTTAVPPWTTWSPALSLKFLVAENDSLVPICHALLQTLFFTAECLHTAQFSWGSPEHNEAPSPRATQHTSARLCMATVWPLLARGTRAHLFTERFTRRQCAQGGAHSVVQSLHCAFAHRIPYFTAHVLSKHQAFAEI